MRDIKKFIELYQSGLTRDEACIQSDIPTGSGSYILRKYDIPTRVQGFQIGNTFGIRFERKHFNNIRRKCVFCNTEFQINVYETKGGDLDKKYCSKKCADKDHGLRQRGSNHWNWQGGKPRTRVEMSTIEYKTWRKQVFERDNYTCQKCGDRGKMLRAHHIKPWKDFPDLRFVISNGITLCNKHHIQEHSRRHR